MSASSVSVALLRKAAPVAAARTLRTAIGPVRLALFDGLALSDDSDPALLELEGLSDDPESVSAVAMAAPPIIAAPMPRVSAPEPNHTRTA
ncbi:hypothetical protein C6A86_020260 [Mycobacterium sp. ITM-2016-00316]|uniref:hypothetical protein n=1 Tax=Mycobacterium sp. ITM-2016-00316 TaxID=2099695 RepID=UPI000CF99D68|nr:hypothetical protein [Mycobacterium sp. ITM-2016-00316]WNG80538.1 hypothetical protein C6A86_020260 [Mycobacterium sp. ITM-2016-00316]